MSKEEWNQYFTGHWNFNGEKQTKHLAMFPEELQKRLIKMFSFVGDTVLDPFLGSGTTTLAAKNLGRNSIGYEINPQFLTFIKEKIGANKSMPEVKFEFINQNAINNNWKSKIQNLPYKFHDPVKFDKKVDPKKLKFGSKIDSTNSERIDLYSVKQVINPEKVLLNNIEYLLEYSGLRPRLDFLLGNLKPLQRTSISCKMRSRLVRARGK
jgi:site-specific DNA-methyltransferase (adenine-specific)